MILLDLVPSAALAAEDTECNKRDAGGNLITDSNCGNRLETGAFDPDQACNQQLELNGNTFLRDPDNNCQNTNGNDSACGMQTSNAPSYDSDDTCGAIDAGNNKMRDEQCDKSYISEDDDKDQYCGTPTTAPHSDKDEFCRPAETGGGPADRDQNCEKTTMDAPLIRDLDEAGLGPGPVDNSLG